MTVLKRQFDARTDENFVIMARTDALGVEGMQSAIDRSNACLEAGADMIFPEAMSKLEDYKYFREHVNAPILANITEFGQTPLFSCEELGEQGVDIVLYCCGAYRAMNKAAETFYRDVLEKGHQRDVVEIMQTREELYDFLGYHDYEQKLDKLFAEGKEK